MAKQMQITPNNVDPMRSARIRKAYQCLPLLAILAGCAPNFVRLEADHVSHPFAGFPFGPADEEAQLTHVNALAEWQSGGWYLTAGVGVKVLERDQRDFVGPGLTGTVRAGYAWRVR